MSKIAVETLEEIIAAEAQASHAPKYLRVFDAFAKGIRSGLFKPGERVPSETELTKRLPVSLGTVQKALTKLAASGMVVRNRKTGTYIADRRSQVDEVFVYRFTDPDTGRAMLPFVRVLSVAVDDSSGPWREALKVDRCVRIDRLVWFDQDPPAFSSVFFSHEHGKVFLDMPMEELHGASSHRLLIEHYNLPTLRMEHRVGCRTLSDAACEHLMVPSGSIGIVWDIGDFSFHDQPSLFQRFQLPPGHRPVEITERINGQASRLTMK
jgi:DNA-binding GntR family transcriptional regulator